MRIAILAQFPIHLLPEFSHLGEPKQHYATWLPQLALSFSEGAEFDFHWVTLTTAVTEPKTVYYLGQTFHLLPTATSKRASTLYRQDRGVINQVLETVNPDLVHGWGTEDVYALSAVTCGRPNVVSMAGLLSYYVLKTKMYAREYFQAVLELFILRRSQQITVETEWGRRVLKKRTSRRIDLVEYGIRSAFFEMGWTPQSDRPVALFVGSIHPRKGIQDAVAAFADPRLKNFELRIAGAGSGSWADGLRRQATPNIRWLGQIPPDQTARELAAAWCLVLPTRCDTSPNVVKEARVVGLPVVTTREGGQSDYIQNGKNGFLVSPGDVSGLASSLAVLLSDLSKTREMGAFLQTEARRHFQPTRTADLLRDIYRRCGSR